MCGLEGGVKEERPRHQILVQSDLSKREYVYWKDTNEARKQASKSAMRPGSALQRGETDRGGGGGWAFKRGPGSVSVAQLSNLEAPEHVNAPPVPTERHGRGFARQAHEARGKSDAGASQELGRKLSLHEWDAHTWGEQTGWVRINTRRV